MKVPQTLLYTSDHEWVSVNGDVARVGITDYAQDALGDIVFAQLPTVGSQLDAHVTLGEIESTKSVNDIYAPLAGVVLAVNEQLLSRPELLNSDPYGEGWICELKVDPTTAASLLSAEAYTALIGG